MTVLPDIQEQSDARGVEIDAVGIKNLRYPVSFSDGDLAQSAIADVSMWVSLPAERRGTHMSRMVEVVHDQLYELDPRTLPIILKAAADKLDVEVMGLAVDFPIALGVASPSSARLSWQVHDLSFEARLNQHRGIDVNTQIRGEVTSLCPCSRAISDYGAHNQRSVVRMTVTGRGDDPYPLPAREGIDLIRSVGSSPVYPLVKREDERYITMQAYDNPSFVEDMVRDLSLQCRSRNLPHRITATNIESIHSHDATASITWKPPHGEHAIV